MLSVREKQLRERRNLIVFHFNKETLLLIYPRKETDHLSK